MSIPGAMGAGVAGTCFVLLSMGAIHSALRRTGTNPNLYYQYTVPGIFVVLTVLAAMDNERMNVIISIALGVLLLLSVAFWLISLTNRQSSNNSAEPSSHQTGTTRAASVVDADPPKTPSTAKINPGFKTILNISSKKLQVIVVSMAIMIAALMAIFPPWVHRPRGIVYARGYAFLFNLGTHKEIDFAVLFVQWCLVALIAGGIVYYLKNREPRPDPKGAELPKAPFLEAVDSKKPSDIDMDELNEFLDTLTKSKPKSSAPEQTR